MGEGNLSHEEVHNASKDWLATCTCTDQAIAVVFSHPKPKREPTPSQEAKQLFRCFFCNILILRTTTLTVLRPNLCSLIKYKTWKAKINITHHHTAHPNLTSMVGCLQGTGRMPGVRPSMFAQQSGVQDKQLLLQCKPPLFGDRLESVGQLTRDPCTSLQACLRCQKR